MLDFTLRILMLNFTIQRLKFCNAKWHTPKIIIVTPATILHHNSGACDLGRVFSGHVPRLLVGSAQVFTDACQLLGTVFHINLVVHDRGSKSASRFQARKLRSALARYSEEQNWRRSHPLLRQSETRFSTCFALTLSGCWSV